MGILPQQPQRGSKVEYIFSNRTNYNLIHRKRTKFLKEWYRIMPKVTETVQNEQKPRIAILLWSVNEL